MLAPPPYTLAPITFGFRALAALAGRLPLGGAREVALATFVGARLAAGNLPPLSLPQPVRRARAAGIRQWVSALALPASARSALLSLAEASAGDDRPALAGAVERLGAQAGAALDSSARRELQQLAATLRAP
jgi:hypothetical protein